jgi:SOS-response transcriptional repressor LexA
VINTKEKIKGKTKEKTALETSNKYFNLRVTDGAMMDRICQGDIITVERQKEVLDGEIAVVTLGSDTVCRILYHTEDGYKLTGRNPHYEDIFVSRDNATIRGKVLTCLAVI